MKNINWDDLKLFLLVVDGGGLTGAVGASGLSAATIGRRMLALEQACGRTLFHRSQTGYTLTAVGNELQKRVRAMEAAAQPVNSLLSDRSETPVIRISAGTGTADFLARNFARLNRLGDSFRLNFVTTESTLDLAHREADLGIRNSPALSGNLASRKLGIVRFAPFRSRNAPRPELLEWVALDSGHAKHPAAQWVLEQGHPIHTMASRVSTVHQLTRSGAGIGLMPCFIGDCDPQLERAGPIIESLTENQYLVMHNDDRNRPPIRRLIERLLTLYRDNAPLLAGQHYPVAPTAQM